MQISILIPCHNEEKSIKRCVESCLKQTRKADEIVVVDDGSTDKSVEILEKFGSKIKLIRILKNMGNKSYVQQYGLNFVTGEVFITADADTILDKNFVYRIAEDFKDHKVKAVAGYVKSIKHNWITACREMDYIISQDIHKVAQAYIDFIYVIPGCAGAFKTETFKKYVGFDHDTLTEDLDSTYKLNEKYQKIKYDREAIVYTQDPSTLKSYIGQLRRWYSGGWQNLKKHYKVAQDPIRALELSLIYVEGTLFSIFIMLTPLISFYFFNHFLIPYFVTNLVVGLYASINRKRLDLILCSPLYVFLLYVNAYIFVEQFVSEVLLRKKCMVWYHPKGEFSYDHSYDWVITDVSFGYYLNFFHQGESGEILMKQLLSCLIFIGVLFFIGGLFYRTFSWYLITDNNVDAAQDYFYKCTPFPTVGSKDKVILRVDDIQESQYQDIIERIVTDATEMQMRLTLGIIPVGISKDKPINNLIEKYKCNLEIAIHGWTHTSTFNSDGKENFEFEYLDEASALKKIEDGRRVLEDAFKVKVITFIPPGNVISEGTEKAIVKSNIAAVSGDEGGYFDYSTSTYDWPGKRMVSPEEVLDDCSADFESKNFCVVMIHPQDFASNGKLDETKYQNYLTLLKLIKTKGYDTVTFADIYSSKPPTVINYGEDEYLMEGGETLWSVAETYYGDGREWPKLLERNQDVIQKLPNGEPEIIKAGTKIIIPLIEQ